MTKAQRLKMIFDLDQSVCKDLLIVAAQCAKQDLRKEKLEKIKKLYEN